MRLRCAILAGCALFFTGALCYASGGGLGTKSNTTVVQVSVPADQDSQNVRTWLNGIKPAAGEVEKSVAHERKHYWQQTVNRKRHSTMEE